MATTEKPSDPTVVGSGVNLPGASPLVAARRPLRRGGVLAAASGRANRDVGTDVTSALDASVPVFGNVLQAIGDGVANSQKALDDGVIASVNTLNDTKIEVMTQVVQKLGDDGLPIAGPEGTDIQTRELSVLNFFMPTLHEWKNVSLAMDLTVGSFHEDQGIVFSQHQHAESVVATGLFWGFLGWFDQDTSDTRSDGSRTRSNDLQWQSGQLRVDATLGPRATNRLPVAASVSIGPQIYVTQGAVHEEKTGPLVTARSVDMEIQVRKADGSVNPGKNIVLRSGGLLPSFTGGSATDAEGKVKVTLKRSLVPGFSAPVSFQLSAALGQLSKSFVVTL
jgi:hypothetical protein